MDRQKSETRIHIERCDDGPPYERCCFCREETAYWAKKTDVACCPDCACNHQEHNLPTKEQWFAQEVQLENISKRNPEKLVH